MKLASFCLLRAQRDQPITQDSLHLCHDLWFWWAEKESQDLEIWIRAQIPTSSQTPTAPTIVRLCNLSSRQFAYHFLQSLALPCYRSKPGQGHGVSITPCTFLTQSSCYTRFDMSVCCLPSSIDPDLFGGKNHVFISVSSILPKAGYQKRYSRLLSKYLKIKIWPLLTSLISYHHPVVGYTEKSLSLVWQQLRKKIILT